MKLLNPKPNAAFTLPEVLIGMGIFAILMIGYLSFQLAGLTLTKYQSIRLRATSDAIAATTKINFEMRGAYSNRVGNTTGGDPNTFTIVSDGANQVGNALQILPMRALSGWICYYYVAASNSLWRADSSGARALMASGVTNIVPVFQEERPDGTVRSDSAAVSLTSVNLSFCTTNAPTTKLFQNSTNFLNFRIRVSPRTL